MNLEISKKSSNFKTMVSVSSLKRFSNLEALRIISILLILSIHIYSEIPYESMNELNKFIGVILSGIGSTGVTCFVLLSGYFGVKFKKERFIQLILLTTFYSVFVNIANNEFTINNDLLKAFLIIPLYKNWFITCYLILMLLSPFLNNFLEQLSQKEYQKLVLILLIVFSILPTAFNTPYYTILSDGGKCLTYFIFIYMIGKYIKRFKDITIKQSKAIIFLIISTTIICTLNFFAEKILGKRVCVYGMDCSPFILFSSIIIFYIFKSFTFQKKWINYISSSVLSVYLLDELRLTIDKHLFQLNTMGDNKFMFIWWLLEIITVFFCAIIIDKIRIFSLSNIENKTIKTILKTYELLNLNKHLR